MYEIKIYKKFYIIACILLTSCATPIKPTTNTPLPASSLTYNENDFEIDPKILKNDINPQLLAKIEANALPANAKVLKQARIMVVNKRIIRGGCWDYINAIWNKAGFPPKRRNTVFKSAKTGPYAHTENIKSGDWLYFINHDYGNIEHSAMFIAWVNKNSMRGYMLSYAGERKRQPARYKIYDLTSVYQVTRPKL